MSKFVIMIHGLTYIWEVQTKSELHRLPFFKRIFWTYSEYVCTCMPANSLHTMAIIISKKICNVVLPKLIHGFGGRMQAKLNIIHALLWYEFHPPTQTHTRTISLFIHDVVKLNPSILEEETNWLSQLYYYAERKVTIKIKDCTSNQTTST